MINAVLCSRICVYVCIIIPNLAEHELYIILTDTLVMLRHKCSQGTQCYCMAASHVHLYNNCINVLLYLHDIVLRTSLIYIVATAYCDHVFNIPPVKRPLSITAQEEKQLERIVQGGTA